MTQSQKLDSVGERRDTLRGGTWTLLLHGRDEKVTRLGDAFSSPEKQNQQARVAREVGSYLYPSVIHPSTLCLYIVRERGRDKFILRNWLTQL